MRRLTFPFFALCLLFLHPAIALADATLALRIRTSAPAEIRISFSPDSYLTRKVIFRSTVDHDTTLIVTLSPKDITTYIVQDDSYRLFDGFTIEDGDSLILSLDLDSATIYILFDKRGYSSIHKRVNFLYASFRRKADSLSQTKNFGQMRPHSYILQREYSEALQPLLDSLKGSGLYSLVKGWRDAFAVSLQFRQLRSPWSDSTKELLCGKTFEFSSFVNTEVLPSDVVSWLIGDWMQILTHHRNNCETNVNIDSQSLAFLHSMPTRERELGFIVYADRELTFKTGKTTILRLDSLRKLLVTSRETADLYQAMLNEIASVSLGAQAPEIALPDTSGTIRKLSELRGKIVLIDFWGTWCPPCLDELPYVDSIARDYAGTDLQILGVSLEYRQRDRWKNFVRAQKLPGLHLYAEAQFNNEQTLNYLINGVPSYFLIDRDGTIISANAPRPSGPKLREIIDKALSRH